MTPEELAAAIRTVLEEASAEGSLALPAAEIPDPRVERPRNRDHGDWSTNVAMQLAKKAGTKPRDLAEFLGVDPASLLPRRVEGAPAASGDEGSEVVPRTGFEPATFCSGGRRSIH